MTKKNKQPSLINNEHQRFSLRKLNIGLASVLLGTFYLSISNTQTVKADTVESPQTEETKPATEQPAKAESESKTAPTETNKTVSQPANANQTAANNTAKPDTTGKPDMATKPDSDTNTDITNNEQEDKQPATIPAENNTPADNTDKDDTKPVKPGDTSTDQNNTGTDVPVVIEKPDDPTDKPVEPATKPATDKKAIKPRKITKSTDANLGLNFEWDETTKNLTISAINGETTINTDGGSLFGKSFTYSNVKKITFVGKIHLQGKSSSSLFRYLHDLESIDGLSNLDFSQATNMSYMFAECSKLTSLDLSNFNTGKVTNMSNMFYECSSLTSLDLSSFNTSNVSFMIGMFFNCSSLASLDVSNLDTSNVTDMAFMFYNCSSLISLDVSNFNTSNANDMAYMFKYCSKLTSLDLSNFNTGKVTDMSDMFYLCSSLTSLNVSKFNTRNVTDMTSMFEGCSSLPLLNLSNFNTSSVTFMIRMFADCSGLTSLDVSNFDTSNVTNMGSMFENCSKLKALDVSNFNTSNVTNMGSMFHRCRNLKTLDLSNFDTSKVDNFSGMFYECSSLTLLDISNFYISDDSRIPGTQGMMDNMDHLRILKLGPKSGFPAYSVNLRNPGFWFKQGTGTINNPEGTKAFTSAELTNSDSSSSNIFNSATDYDTYIRGVRYQVDYIDQDNNNKSITNIDKNATTYTNYLTNYPDNVDIGTDLKLTIPDNLQKQLTALDNANYELVSNPFGDDGNSFTPTADTTKIDFVFKHKLGKTTENKNVNFVIKYVTGTDNQEIKPKDTITTTFSREVTTDLVTDNKTYGDWVLDPNSANQQLDYPIKVPVIKGYIAEKATYPNQAITADAKDETLVINYQQLGSFIPVDKNGKQVGQVAKIQYENDPNDPTKGIATIPAIKGYTPVKDTKLPTDLTKDTKVVYLENNQTVISFVDQDNNNQALADTITTSTEIGQNITKPATVDQVVQDLQAKGYELVNDPFKDAVAATDGKQELVYIFKHKQDDTQKETVTRKQIIHLVDADGKKLQDDQVKEVTFTRTGTKDLVTGKITWNEWTKDQALPVVKLPVINGYVTDKSTVPAQTISHDQDVETTVTYQKLGSFVPVDKNGKQVGQNAKISYENDPTDPTKIKQDLPTIEGYTPAKDTKLPTDLTKDTKVTYLANNQTEINFIDQDNDNQPITGIESIASATEIGQEITKPANIDQIVKDLTNKGYELVKDPFSDKVVATDGKQVLNYVFKHKQDDTQKETVTRKQIIHLVDAAGNSLKDDQVKEVTFTRTGTKDLVTGKITWNDWTKDQILPAVKLPVINGYVTDKSMVPAQTISHDKDVETTVTYQKLGSFVPVDKNGKQVGKDAKVPYENDPTDPTKIKTVFPSIAGYVPDKDTKLPTDPTKDTKVVYLENNQTVISFVDQDNDNLAIADPITVASEIGQEINKPNTIAQIIKDLANKGYELVKDPFSDKVIATDGQQTLMYVFKHKQDATQKETVTRKQIIHLVDADGKKLQADQVKEVTFTRTGIKDLVTGITTWDAWTTDQTLPAVKLPVINGYVTDKAEVPTQTISHDKDVETTVTYHKLGSFIPVDQNGKQVGKDAKIPYENDPNDPTKIKPSQKLPTIAGYVTPKVPEIKDLTQDTQVVYVPAASGNSGSDHDHNQPEMPIIPAEPDKPTVPDDPTQPTKPTQPSKPKPHKPQHSIKPTKPNKPQSTAKQPARPTAKPDKTNLLASTTVKAATVEPATKTVKTEQRLPQTGAKSTDSLSLIWLGMLLIELSLPFGLERKRKH